MKSRTHLAVLSVLMALSTGLTCNATLAGFDIPGESLELNLQHGNASIPGNGAGPTTTPKYAEADMGHEIWEGTKSTAENTGTAIENAGEKTGRTLKHVGERTGSTLERVGEKTEVTAKHVYHRTGSTAKHVYHRTKRTLESVGERVATRAHSKHSCYCKHHVAMRRTTRTASLEPVGEQVTTYTTTTTTRRMVPNAQPESVGERTLIERYQNPESPLAHPRWENDYANPYR